MNIYYPHYNATSDYNSIRTNGMWYQNWQSGYNDIIKKGYPRPSNDETIIAELYSASTEDFLHGFLGDVPFLISESAKTIFNDNHLSGFKYVDVEIAKISTKRKFLRKEEKGEPEDLIYKNRNVINEVEKPKLYGIKVTSLLEVNIQKASNVPDGYIIPFKFYKTYDSIPDLFFPACNGEIAAKWCFCSENFRNVIEKNKLTNIIFIPFKKYIKDYKIKLKKRK